MAQVTIEGSITPCVELARGEQRTVQHTDHVQRLIDRGFVKVVEWFDEEDSAAEPGQVTVSVEADVSEAQEGIIKAKLEAGDGGTGADPGQPDPVRPAAEGTDDGGAVDPADQTAPGPRVRGRARAGADSAP